MNLPHIKKFTLSRDDRFMEGWPDLIRLASGRVILLYNECVAHSNRDHTHITQRVSDDNGVTWSEKRYIAQETFHGDQWNSIRVNQLSDGRILLVCDRISGVETSAETELWLWESRDDGESWSEGKPLGIYGYCSDKVRELSDGTLLLCISAYNPQTGKTEVMAHRSSDFGATWSEQIPVAQSGRYTFIEPATLELSDGTVVVFLRENSMKGFNGFLALSHDKGLHFEPFSEIPVSGMHRPFVGHLSDGRILLSYREHLGGKYPDLKLCIFSEGDIQIESPTSFTTYSVDHDQSEQPDQGYSAWVQLPDNTVLMANYIVDDAPKAFIRGYRITLPNPESTPL